MSRSHKAGSGAGTSGNGSGSSSPVRSTARVPAQLRSAHSLPDIASPRALLSRSLFARQHGYTFGGLRNIDETLGYKPDLTVADYRQRYLRGGIAKRVVEAFPRATWTPGSEVYEDEDPEVTTDFEADVAAVFERLGAWEKLLRADILAGIGRYSVLLIGVAHPSKLDTELPKVGGRNGAGGVDSLIYLTPYGEDRAPVESLVEDESDPRFGLPLTYRVTFGKKKSTGQTVERIVHWTRIIHVAEGLLEDEVYGQPRLQDVWDYLDDLKKVEGGGSEAAWNRMDPGFHVNAPLFGPDGQELEPMDEDEMALEFEERRHGLKRDLYTRGVEVTPLSASVASFGANVESIIQLIAGTKGYPKRILVGSERGEQASTQDRENWHDRSTERQHEFNGPLVSQLVKRLVDYRYIRPTRDKAPWVVWFAEKNELAETEKPSVVAQLASANQAQVHAEGQLILTSAEIREQVYGLEPLPEPEVEDGGEEPEIDDEGEDQNEDDGETDGEDADPPASLRSAAESFDLADSPADEPEWRSVHRAADAHRDSLARLFLGAWRDAADELTGDSGSGADLELALAGRSVLSVTSMVDAAVRAAEQRVLEVLPGRLHGVLVDGALAGLRAARARGGWRSAQGLDTPVTSTLHSQSLGPVAPLGIPSSGQGEPRPLPVQSGADAVASMRGESAHLPSGDGVTASSSGAAPVFHAARFSASFNATNPRAVAYGETRSVALVTQIGGDTRAALRELVAAGLRDGVPPAKLRQYVAQSVGLRTDQVEAVWRLRGRLATAKPGSTVRAGKVRIKVPRTGPSASFIDRHAERYSRKLLNDRALLIARTETLRSANAGQRELWVQAQESGSLPADARRRWISTPDDRTRLEHAAMDGQEVGVGQPFDPAIEPGEEPACRCAMGLV